jgi:Outer membrane protein beta-barrel domain
LIFRITLSLSFFLFFVSEVSLAQNFKWGVKGGLSLPNLTSNGGSDVSKGYKTISGPDFALVGDYNLSERVSLETSLEWSTQGGQKSGLQTIPASPELAQYFPPGSDAQYLYANFTSTVRLQYIMLPVLLKYNFDIGNSGKWRWYIDGGIFGGLLVTAKASAEGSSKVYFDKNETNEVGNVTVQFDSTGDIKNQLHKGNVGVEGNLGLLYQIKNVSVFAEGGGNYGFIDLQKNSQNGINHTGALIFRIGILLSVRRKA